MPLIRFPTVKGLVYTIDLSKIADRANPRTVEAPIQAIGTFPEPITIDWGDGVVETIASAESRPSHEYSAVGKYTVTIRSVTGNLPRISVNKGQTINDVTNTTYAIVSLDHFGGQINNSNRQIYLYIFFNTVNMTYCDPRIIAPGYGDLYKCFQNSGIEQPLASFCLDFCALDSSYTFDSAFQNTKVNGPIPGGFFKNAVSAQRFSSTFSGCNYLTGPIPKGLFDNCVSATIINSTFSDCSGLTSIPDDLFDNCPNITSFINAFRRCTALAGEPYVFWNADGTINTDKFPSLTAENAGNCYAQSSLIAKVPTAYGGTMTVSS